MSREKEQVNKGTQDLAMKIDTVGAAAGATLQASLAAASAAIVAARTSAVEADAGVTAAIAALDVVIGTVTASMSDLGKNQFNPALT